jgi:hypothetical protein
VAAVQLLLERAVQHVVHERALPRAAHAGHHGERAERHADVGALEVVLARAGERDPPRPQPAPLGGERHGALAREVLAGERALGGAADRAGEHQLAPLLAAPRADLDHVVGHLDRLGVVLDDEHRVAGVAQAAQQAEQPLHVARVQPHARLVEHVERVHEARPERVGEADALRLAAGERARGAVEREVAEPHVDEEAHPRARLVEDVGGDLPLGAAQLEPAEPPVERVDRHRRGVADRPLADAHGQRLGLEARAPARGALLRGLVLPEEDADVLLVALLFLAPQEREGADEAAPRAVQDALLLGARELRPRPVGRDPLAARELHHLAPLGLVTRLLPRVDGAGGERALGVADDERLVVLEHGAEAVARLAGAARVVEREELRRRGGEAGAVVRALEPLREVEPAHRRPACAPCTPAGAGMGSANTSAASPSPSRNAVPIASLSRAAVSADAARRSTTTSSSVAAVRSSPRAPTSSRCSISPSTATRTNPCARRFSTTTGCVTLAERRSGKATVKRVPAGSAATRSTTLSTVSGRSSRPHAGQ